MDLNTSIDSHLEKIQIKFELEKIKGTDLLNITSFRQLNLFLLKNIYDKWESNFETNKIKYFNYDSNDLIKATDTMMNILSNNISIEINDFNDLFNISSKQIISLANNPKAFIKQDLLMSEWYDADKIKKKAKYYHYHKKLFQMLVNKIKSNNEVSVKASELVNYIDNIVLERNEDFIEEACSFFNLKKENLLSTNSQIEDDYYTFFNLNKNEVDNLITEALNKKTFEDTISLIINSFHENYKNDISNKKIRDFFHSIKEKKYLSSK